MKIPETIDCCENHNPDNVDKVPVPGSSHHGEVAVLVVMTNFKASVNDHQHDQACHDVETVEAGDDIKGCAECISRWSKSV